MILPTKLAKGVHFIPGTGLCSNIYALESGRKVMLVDSGTGDSIPSLDAWLSGREVERVLLTHGHADHVSGMHYISADGLMHKSDLEALEEINTMFPGFKPPNNLDPLDAGEYVFGGFRLRVIETPGHTPGSVCFFEEKTGFLFSGDTKFAGGGVGRTDLPGGDPGELEKSLEKIAGLEYSLLCPGHGPTE